MSWQNQEINYVVMYRSRVSGATKTELRRTDYGFKRLMDTLAYLGYDVSEGSEEVLVTKQKKAWKPIRKGGFKKKDEENGEIKVFGKKSKDKPLSREERVEQLKAEAKELLDI